MLSTIIFVILIVASVILFFLGLASIVLKKPSSGVELIFSLVCAALAFFIWMLSDGFSLF